MHPVLHYVPQSAPNHATQVTRQTPRLLKTPVAELPAVQPALH